MFRIQFKITHNIETQNSYQESRKSDQLFRKMKINTDNFEMIQILELPHKDFKEVITIMFY